MSGPLRVLIVDDSAFVRKVLRKVLSTAGMDVIDHARDGLEALEKIERLRPDVITLDLMMPHLDGNGVLEQLARRPEAPAVVVVSISGADTEAGVEALQRGAVAIVEKPSALASGRLYELQDDLIDQVRVAASARPRIESHERSRVPDSPGIGPIAPARDIDLIVLGTSTGGPQALTKLLAALPGDLGAPMAIALHIPPGYTEALAERLDRTCRLEVVEAHEGQLLVPGRVTLARAGMHLRVVRSQGGLVAQLGVSPVQTLHRPSVDVLFESAAKVCGSRALGVVLTGMGTDGLAGAKALHRLGASVLTEAEETCVVWGMPRAVWEAGIASAQHPLPSMAEAIVRRLHGPGGPEREANAEFRGTD